jgi:hypothetical protein
MMISLSEWSFPCNLVHINEDVVFKNFNDSSDIASCNQLKTYNIHWKYAPRHESNPQKSLAQTLQVNGLNIPDNFIDNLSSHQVAQDKRVKRYCNIQLFIHIYRIEPYIRNISPRHSPHHDYTHEARINNKHKKQQQQYWPLPKVPT